MLCCSRTAANFESAACEAIVAGFGGPDVGLAGAQVAHAVEPLAQGIEVTAQHIFASGELFRNVLFELRIGTRPADAASLAYQNYVQAFTLLKSSDSRQIS